MRVKQTYQSLAHSASQFNSTVGCSIEVFECLLPDFENQWESYILEYTLMGEKRVRQARTRPDANFETNADKLAFILSYLKNNPLQETHAVNWGLTQSRANVWIHLLSDLLLKAFDSLGTVPAQTQEELNTVIENIKKVFLDGTERPIQRSGNNKEQFFHFSGKKNAYSKK